MASAYFAPRYRDSGRQAHAVRHIRRQAEQDERLRPANGGCQGGARLGQSQSGTSRHCHHRKRLVGKSSNHSDSLGRAITSHRLFDRRLRRTATS